MRKKKRCSGCRKRKFLDQFHWKIREKGTRQSRCKICSRKAVNKHFANNRPKYRLRNKTRKQETRVLYFTYLSVHGCVDCPEKDPVVLVPDHVRGKKIAGVSRLLKAGRSWITILRELKKCDIRCANCHARKTAREQGWYKLVGVQRVER